MQRFFTVHSREDLLRLVMHVGFLPFFSNSLPGWSLEEHADPAIWFTSEEGPWEWKGQLASRKQVIYGKFFHRKAAFVSPDIFSLLASFRREGMTFQERADDGTVPRNDMLFMNSLTQHPGIRSSYLKHLLPFSKGFDTVSARLQMQTDVVIQDFVYDIDRHGKPYGWGNAALITADQWLGQDWADRVEDMDPDASMDQLTASLHRLMSDIPSEQFRRELC